MISQQFDIFLFDLDGVIYIGKDALPEASNSLARLRTKGKHIRFLTNDPGPTRQQFVRRLQLLNIEAEESEIVTSGWATARYMQQQGFHTAYIVGSQGLHQELEECGIVCRETGLPETVVIGCDDEVTYRQIRQGAFFIQQGAEFIATNADLTYPTPQGRSPATGTIVETIRVATEKAPIIIGKPFAAMFVSALSTLDPHLRAVMIGDTPTADILGAHRVGLPALLISTHTPCIMSSDEPLLPDAYIPDLSYLFREDFVLPTERIENVHSISEQL